MIFKYSEQGPLPAYIDMEENLSETLKNDVYKKDIFCIFDNFYLNIPTENLPVSAVLTNSTILFDKNIDQAFFTSSLAFSNLELEKMYVLPLK